MDPTVEFGKTINVRLQELKEENPGLVELTDYLKVNDSKLSRFIFYLRSTKVLVVLRGVQPSLIVAL